MAFFDQSKGIFKTRHAQLAGRDVAVVTRNRELKEDFRRLVDPKARIERLVSCWVLLFSEKYFF